MAPQDNKRLIRRALDEIYTRGDLELTHPDFIDHERRVPSSRAARRG